MPTIDGRSTQGIENCLTFVKATIGDAKWLEGEDAPWVKITNVQGKNQNHYIAFVKLSDLVSAVAALNK
jgi:hypothetical protein